jgi:hypothetical protein
MADPLKAKHGKGRKTLWQPPEERDHVSDEAKKWLEENAEAAKGWAKWVEEHGLPLEEYRMF